MNMEEKGKMQKQSVGQVDLIIPGIEKLSKGVVSDPIADLLVCLRQSQVPVVYTQASNLKRGVLEVLREEGFIRSFSEISYRCCYHSEARARSALAQMELTSEAQEIARRRVGKEASVEGSVVKSFAKGNRPKLPFSFFPLVGWRRHAMSFLRRRPTPFRKGKGKWKRKKGVSWKEVNNVQCKWRLLGNSKNAPVKNGYKKHQGNQGYRFGGKSGFLNKPGVRGRVGLGLSTTPVQQAKPVYPNKVGFKGVVKGNVGKRGYHNQAPVTAKAKVKGSSAKVLYPKRAPKGVLGSAPSSATRCLIKIKAKGSSSTLSQKKLVRRVAAKAPVVVVSKKKSFGGFRAQVVAGKARYSLACYNYMRVARIVPPKKKGKKVVPVNEVLKALGRPLSLAPWKAKHLAEELLAAEMKKPHWVRFRSPTRYNDLPYDHRELGPLHLKVPHEKFRQEGVRLHAASGENSVVSASSALSKQQKKKVGYFEVQLMPKGIRSTKRISRPGGRVYASASEVRGFLTSTRRSFGNHSRVLGQSGIGCVILSTSQGILSYRQAVALGLGGEVLCSVG
jgi:ribosomal protein S8